MIATTKQIFVTYKIKVHIMHHHPLSSTKQIVSPTIKTLNNTDLSTITTQKRKVAYLQSSLLPII
jgi:hypothetical protein